MSLTRLAGCRGGDQLISLYVSGWDKSLSRPHVSQHVIWSAPVQKSQSPFTVSYSSFINWLDRPELETVKTAALISDILDFSFFTLVRGEDIFLLMKVSDHVFSWTWKQLMNLELH